MTTGWTTFSGPLTVSNSGPQDVYAFSVDQAGNVENPTRLGTLNIASGTDLSATAAGPASASAGTDVVYDFGVKNLGVIAAQNVVLTYTLPAEATFGSATQTGAPTLTCTTPTAGSNGTLNCSIAALATATNATVHVVVHVLPGTPNGVSLGHVASVVTTTPDSNPANDSARVDTIVATLAEPDELDHTCADSNDLVGAELLELATVRPEECANISLRWNDRLSHGWTHRRLDNRCGNYRGREDNAIKGPSAPPEIWAHSTSQFRREAMSRWRHGILAGWFPTFRGTRHCQWTTRHAVPRSCLRYCLVGMCGVVSPLMQVCGWTDALPRGTSQRTSPLTVCIPGPEVRLSRARGSCWCKAPVVAP